MSDAIKREEGKTKMKRQIRLLITLFAVALLSHGIADAQVASNPPYTLDQSVIAGGGGQNATGGTFSLDGTIGQSIAGTTSSNQPFSLSGGFWTPAPLAPTAASVSVSGRVLTPDGRGLQNAIVVLTDATGERRMARTTSFGYYRFNEVSAGETYIFSVASKRYIFASQVVFVSDENNELNFVAL